MSGFVKGGQMTADPAASDEYLEDWEDLPRTGGPSAGVLLALLAEGIALVGMGAWILIVG